MISYGYKLKTIFFFNENFKRTSLFMRHVSLSFGFFKSYNVITAHILGILKMRKIFNETESTWIFQFLSRNLTQHAVLLFPIILVGSILWQNYDCSSSRFQKTTRSRSLCMLNSVNTAMRLTRYLPAGIKRAVSFNEARICSVLARAGGRALKV